MTFIYPLRAFTVFSLYLFIYIYIYGCTFAVVQSHADTADAIKWDDDTTWLQTKLKESMHALAVHFFADVEWIIVPATSDTSASIVPFFGLNFIHSAPIEELLACIGLPNNR